MKTAVTVLQEMMVKMGLMPEYECISQTGPQHQALFEYRCLACGEVATAAARSKKEAKQEVARVMLQRLSARGHPVPAPFGLAGAAASGCALHDDSTRLHRPWSQAEEAACDHGRCNLVETSSIKVTTGSPADTRSYVALLKELCQQFRLAGVEYELVGDTGPPHLRHFTVRARIGQHERLATSTTKKAARQLAAEKLYTYLRENLARVTKDFDEEEALARAHDKAMERFQEPSDEYLCRPDLGQRIADYHLGLVSGLDAETHSRAAAVLAQERAREAASPERVLARAAAALRLDVGYGRLARAGQPPLALAELSGRSPDLAFDGAEPADAARAALAYVRRALADWPAPHPV